MKKLFLLIAVAMLSTTAVAQMRATTKQECTRRCLALDPDNPAKAQHEQRLKQLRDKKAAEPDASKRKVLEQAEGDEIDRHQDALEKMCRDICATNPEE